MNRRFLICVLAVTLLVPSSAAAATNLLPSSGTQTGPTPGFSWTLDAATEEFESFEIANDPVVDTAGAFHSENRVYYPVNYYRADGMRLACCSWDDAVKATPTEPSTWLTAGTYWWQISTSPKPTASDPYPSGSTTTAPMPFTVQPKAEARIEEDWAWGKGFDHKVMQYKTDYDAKHNLGYTPKVKFRIYRGSKMLWTSTVAWGSHSSNFEFERRGIKRGVRLTLRVDVIGKAGKVVTTRRVSTKMGRSATL